MDVTTISRPAAATDEVPPWDWRRELKSLDSQLAAAERGSTWDWRAELEELEERLGQLERKHGLAG